jgi:retron-type reverse transcriptase
LKFEVNQEEKLLNLQNRLMSWTYRPGRSILFAAVKPKLREIFAADFEDRIVHHILVRELEKVWEPRFIYDSYACRKDKGIHGAAMRAQKFIRQVSANGTRQACYIKLDIKNFFNEPAWSLSFFISSDGTPYVAYTDFANGSMATVMKYVP